MNQLPPYLKLFQGEEHQPFHWNGGQPAALLVHGFPGTPAEMRPLGTALHRAGWTVHGPLLPGFGPDIRTLFERDYTEWVAAIESKLVELQQQHSPVLLVGHSMGGAISLHVAAARQPDALILTAPFWQLGEWWQRGIGMVLKPFLRQIRPFKKVDFFDPNIRRGIENFLPDIDLDDPNVQSEIRNFAVPMRIFEQLLRVGQAAYRLAPRVDRPILIMQGTHDETVLACRTRRLLQQLPGPVRYAEIITGHDLTRAEDPGWPHVERAVLEFAQSFAQRFENDDNVYSPILEKTI